VISDFAAELAHGFLQASGAPAPLPGPPPPPSFVPYLSMGAAIVLAVYALQRQRIARFLVDGLDRATWPLAQALREVHSGLIGDYVTWIVVGLLLLGGMFVFV
jgi:multicomponent Na+:H+ antiporter subunit D